MELIARLAFATTLFKVICCQTVTVTVADVNGEYGTTTQLSCGFSVSPPAGYTWRELKWSKGTADIASFLSTVPDPTYGTGYAPPQYIATSTDSDSNLKITSVKFEDAGTYKCEAVFRDATLNRVTGEDSGDLTVYVPPKPVGLKITYDGKPYSDGASFPVVAGNGRQFVCTATGITPAATFAWSGTGTDVLVGTPTQTNTPTTAPLMDSTSTITVNILEDPATQNLECQAHNTPDGSNGASIAVTLQVEAPTTTLGPPVDGSATPPKGSTTVKSSTESSSTPGYPETHSRGTSTLEDSTESTGSSTPTNPETTPSTSGTGTSTLDDSTESSSGPSKPETSTSTASSSTGLTGSVSTTPSLLNSTTAQTTTTQSRNDGDDSESGLSTGAIIGIAVGAAAAVAILVAVIGGVIWKIKPPSGAVGPGNVQGSNSGPTKKAKDGNKKNEQSANGDKQKKKDDG